VSWPKATEPRPITKVDDTYAHPCGCVTVGGIDRKHATEACASGRSCTLFPDGRIPGRVKIRGRPI
jgi:hypothetical protein